MSKKEVHKFFNFPIQLLEGFLKKNDSYFEILDNVSQYAVYTYSKNFRMKGGE